MIAPRLRTLSLLILAAGAVQAQSLKEGLALLPARCNSVEVYPNPARAEQRGSVLEGLSTKPGSFTGLKSKLGLAPSELEAGVLLVGELEQQGAKKPENAEKLPTAFLAALPAAKAEALLAKLHAKKGQGSWTYHLGGAKGELRYAAARPGFVLVSDKAWALDEAMAARENLAAELDAPLESWLMGHDAAFLVGGRELRKSLADMAESDPKKASTLPKAFRDHFKDLGAKAKASIIHAALGLDFPEGGALRFSGRAFYRPGSPLAQDAAASAPLGMHPLTGLPQDAYALALGGQWPSLFNLFGSDPELAFLAFGEKTLPEDAKARCLAAMKASQDQIESMACLLEPGSKSEDPLLHKTVMLYRVKDAAAYEQAAEAVAAAQGELAKAAGMEPFTTFTRDILPGQPSYSSSIDLGRMGAAPGQARMFMSMLFGGTDLKMSSAQLDGHTWLTVFGGAEDLKWALLRTKQGAGLPEDPLQKRADQLLPPVSRFSLYLSPKGLRDLAQVAMAAFGRGQALPEVKAVPPAGAVLLLDAGGVEVQAAAQPETIAAVKAFFDEMKKSAPAPKEEAAD